MQRELPNKPNLDHLKKQAKDLLEAFKRGEPEAIERFRASLPSFAKATALALHDAQSTIAREYGYASWAALRAAVEERAPMRELVRALMMAHPSAPLPPS